ncbi:hypothetical protein, partial [Bradyrhizobium sp. 177]|uniref:hypothetical protein n=1 Tax=Bradyrhizobium sp. 177 TaxID=2782647 RepID=UPI001FF80EB3
DSFPLHSLSPQLSEEGAIPRDAEGAVFHGARHQFSYRDPLEAEYRQLIELRERVRQAEAAASKQFTIATRKGIRRNEDASAGRHLLDARGGVRGVCSARVVTTKVRSSRVVDMPWWRAWGRSVQSLALRPL